MKKLTLIFVTIFAIICLMACVPSSQDAETKMKDKGYYSVNAASIYKDNEDTDVETVIAFAEGKNLVAATANLLGGGDYVLVIYYKNADAAKAKYEAIKDDYTNKTCVLSGKVVFYGTEKGVKDFRS